jgi:molybdate transport system substrate-binding protein
MALGAACAALLGLHLASAQPAPVKLADAPAGSVRLFVSGAMRAPVEAVRGRLEAATGRRLVVESGESRTLQAEIEAGQPFEAAVLTTPVIKDMIGKGRILAGGEAVVSVVRTGAAVRGDAPKLDVSTPEGLKRALLGAHVVRRSYGTAASTPIIEAMLARLAVGDALKDRMVALTAPEQPLGPGQYEIIVNLVSAIAPMQGWTYLGLIPDAFQAPILHSAGIGAAGDPALGRQVLAVLHGPEFEAALKANGATAR